MAIQRDNWREQNSGRGVGENIISQYSKNMSSAFNSYRKEGQKPDGLVDRLMHFKWEALGASPIKGNWKLISDNKFFLKRRLKK